MRYIPNSPEEREEMLEIVGLKSADELFRSIPADVLLNRKLNVTEPLAEPEVIGAMESLAAKNTAASKPSFLGAGVYSHYSPTVVDHLIQRSEFFTSYTPYQPEISQGTLQYIFEFQTLVCQLTGMDVANASMYDGSTAMAEAFLMAQRVTRKDKVVIAQTVHPEYLQVAETYTQHGGLTVETVHFDQETGRVLDEELNKLDDKTAAFVVQSPNFFGCIEDLQKLADKAHEVGALIHRRRHGSDFFRFAENSGRVRRGYCRRRRSVVRNSDEFRRTASRTFRLFGKICPANARKTRGRGLRQKRQTRFCVDSGNPRTAYSPRQSDIEYLHESRFDRARRDDLYGNDGQKRFAGSRRAKCSKMRLCRKRNFKYFRLFASLFRAEI